MGFARENEVLGHLLWGPRLCGVDGPDEDGALWMLRSLHPFLVHDGDPTVQVHGVGKQVLFFSCSTVPPPAPPSLVQREGDQPRT